MNPEIRISLFVSLPDTGNSVIPALLPFGFREFPLLVRPELCFASKHDRRKGLVLLMSVPAGAFTRRLLHAAVQSVQFLALFLG